MLRPVALAALFVAACSTTSTTPSNDGGATNEGGSSSSDAGPAGSPCAVTRAYVEKCAPGDLTCGASGFDAWCAANDSAVNSDAYRRAELACLPTAACDGVARRDCEYKSYAKETPTAAQKTLVEAYCQTCEPADVAGCTTRSTTYDPAAGPEKVTDIFIAAWELSDAVTDTIREKCTGGALDAGAPNATACASAFASCAAGPYLDAVPDCP